jgi:uncharacterized protein (DUF488 family)
MRTPRLRGRSNGKAAIGRALGSATVSFFTIGHSTRPIEAFLELLQRMQIGVVADVRTVPRSRTNPQYDGNTLARTLAESGIGYEHIAALGGLRGKQRGISPAVNAFWENASFHNYADYAMTPAFRDGLTALRTLGKDRQCAIMCAEAVWWRCHRRIIADYLLREGDAVFHILGTDRVEPAQRTEAARPGPHRTLVYPSAAEPDEVLRGARGSGNGGPFDRVDG